MTISGHRVADLHRVRVHHPGHRLLVGRHVRRGDVALRADDRQELRGEAARQALQLGLRRARADRSARRPSRRRTAAGGARTSRSSTSRARRTRRASPPGRSGCRPSSGRARSSAARGSRDRPRASRRRGARESRPRARAPGSAAPRRRLRDAGAGSSAPSSWPSAVRKSGSSSSGGRCGAVSGAVVTETQSTFATPARPSSVRPVPPTTRTVAAGVRSGLARRVPELPVEPHLPARPAFADGHRARGRSASRRRPGSCAAASSAARTRFPRPPRGRRRRRARAPTATGRRTRRGRARG